MRGSWGCIGLGYRLHEGPAVTFNGQQVIVAQALLWLGADERAGRNEVAALAAAAYPGRVTSTRLFVWWAA